MPADNLEQAEVVWKEGNVPILEDSDGSLIEKLRPFAVVDAILAKKNIGTSKSMAPVTIALGPTLYNHSDAVSRSCRWPDLLRRAQLRFFYLSHSSLSALSLSHIVSCKSSLYLIFFFCKIPVIFNHFCCL